jgi:hypothetical protein
MRVAAAIDEAEARAHARVGGLTSADAAVIKRLEASLPAPFTADDWRWTAQRLSRAILNGWTPRAVAPLIRLATVHEAD